MGPPRVRSCLELEKSLEELIIQVENVKNQLRVSFYEIHEILRNREEELLKELTAIPDRLSCRIEERKVSLNQLIINKHETEQQLQANRLSDFLKKQLTNIEEEIDKIISENINFPHVILNLDKQLVQKQIKKTGLIVMAHYAKHGAEPVWSGVKGGKRRNELSVPTALCIDPKSQLIYVSELDNTHRIQVFSSEGKYHSSILSKAVNEASTIRIYGSHIYTNSSANQKNTLLKLNLDGKIIQIRETTDLIGRLYVHEGRVFCCYLKFIALDLFDLSLKPISRLQLNAKSHDYNTFTRDIIVHREKIIVLFSSGDGYHHNPIQVFTLDGKFTHSVVSGSVIREASYFCIDSYENFILTDRADNCIRIISQNGVLLQTVGAEGNKTPGQLYSPKGIAIDASGNIVVVDWKDNYRLQAF